MAEPTRRVARIITRLNVGGPAIQAIDLSRELGPRGFETCLVHGSLSPAEGDMTVMAPVVSAQTLYVPALRRPVSLLNDVRACWSVYRALHRWRPDIVHTHMAKAGALGRLAALAYRRTSGRPVRIVHTYHGHVFEGYFEGWKTRLFLSIERWLGRRTDTLIAISSEIRRDIVQTYGIAGDRQVALIPLGFHLDRLSAITAADRERAKADLDIPAGTMVVTTVGRLTAIKQHGLLLETAERLAGRFEHMLFLIVGDGELRHELEVQAGRLGLGSRVRFLGWRRDLERIYGATDVFVLTSRNEGTPVALIEAMASGVASVSTDVGGVRDVVTSADVGTLVPFGDPEALAAAVGRFACDPVLRQTIGRASREAVVGRFHLRRLVDDISGLYRQLLAFD